MTRIITLVLAIEMVAAPATLIAAGADAVREVVYKQVDGVELRLIIHEPPRDATGDQPRAAIVLFYGGGWNGGSIEQFTPQAEHLARRGMVAIRAEYRVRSRHGVSPFECMADARDAIRWVRENAEQLKIDSHRLAAGGGSAGGHIALCAAVLPDAPAEDDATSCVPDALVLFNPVADVTPRRFADRFAGRAKDASPLHHVRPGLSPTLIMHGDADTTVPIEQIRAFRDKMLAAGNQCELIEYPGRAHGFFNAARGRDEDHAATLRAADEFLVKHNFLPPQN